MQIKAELASSARKPVGSHAGGCNDTPREIGSRVRSFVLGYKAHDPRGADRSRFLSRFGSSASQSASSFHVATRQTRSHGRSPVVYTTGPPCSPEWTWSVDGKIARCYCISSATFPVMVRPEQGPPLQPRHCFWLGRRGGQQQSWSLPHIRTPVRSSTWTHPLVGRSYICRS